jgi:RNA polymerase sigma factor (sigma-70 family)
MPEPKQNISDEELVESSLKGDRKSMETLIKRYQDFIYNVSLKMTWNKDDSADITQEVLIKVITKLDSFKHNSSFKTWLYRITVNHILNERKAASAKSKMTFRQYGEGLDNAPDSDFTADEYYGADTQLLVEETKQTCMSGMLMCLDKKHRIVFILAELFGVNDSTGSELLEVSKENFRMMLSRAKKDLYSFVHNKCGLINKENPCRCAKKTKSFIKAGFVNPKSLVFTERYKSTIEEVAGEKQMELEDTLYSEYRQLYLQHNYLQGPDFANSLNEWLSSDKIRHLFNFN